MTSHDTTLINMNNHISLKKRGVAITRSHTPTQCRTYFGQYQLPSASLGWLRDGDNCLM